MACKPRLERGREAIDRNLNPDYDPDDENGVRAPFNPSPSPITDKRKKSAFEYSMQLNASRIKVLQAQDDLANSMRESASKELLDVSHDHHSYKHRLKNLIVQDLALLHSMPFGR